MKRIGMRWGIGRSIEDEVEERMIINKKIRKKIGVIEEEWSKEMVGRRDRKEDSKFIIMWDWWKGKRKRERSKWRERKINKIN